VPKSTNKYGHITAPWSIRGKSGMKREEKSTEHGPRIPAKKAAKIVCVVMYSFTHLPFWGHWACDTWPLQCQTSGYLPGQKALPLPIGWYSFHISLGIGSRVKLNHG